MLPRTLPRALPSLSRSAFIRFASSGAPSLSNPALWKTSGFLNGEWTAGSSKDKFAVYNPGTGGVLGEMPEMGVDETKKAIEFAYEAGKGEWGTTSEYDRAKVLNKLFALMNEHAEDLAKIITAENGKPMTDARGEITYGASFIEWFAGEAVRNYGDIVPSGAPGVQNLVFKQPVGVCGIITPWNFPFAMITRKLGAALAAGCTAVLKAPAETPYTTLAIAELCRQAGVPDGVVNVVVTEKGVAAVGKELCENPLVKKISFTGSTRVGKILMQQSSSTLKKLSMELGGNAPFIVFDDADVDKAVAGAIISKFRLSGQTCVCANRIFVQSGIYDAFSTALVKAVSGFKVGEGSLPGITHGPLIHQAAVDKVERHVKSAVDGGAKVLVGGKRGEGEGYFFQPTVLGDVKVGISEIDEDETFGPLAPLYKFETEEEVIKLANAPEVGLAGYFFSQDYRRIDRVGKALQVGMVGANTGLVSQTAIPFGGIGQSGFGREGSKYGLQDYQNIKLVAVGGY
ncbi:succinate-semialdehyde dehydrogenase (NADP+) [Pseudohyphozyma bogoriensis]|nr:succinate-semialdehyde dehydrogenase (NADP+) [Pseudohyphozyma bogoriensis]